MIVGVNRAGYYMNLESRVGEVLLYEVVCFALCLTTINVTLSLRVTNLPRAVMPMRRIEKLAFEPYGQVVRLLVADATSTAFIHQPETGAVAFTQPCGSLAFSRNGATSWPMNC
jgi:hypothetical protein